MVRDLAVLESLNQQVLDALPSGILFCDTDYIVRRVNACYAALLGGKVSSILGRPLTELNPATRAPIVIKNGKPELGDLCTLPLFGDNYKFVVNRVPVRDNQGDVIGMVSHILFTDPNELKELHDKIDLLQKKKKIYNMKSLIILPMTFCLVSARWLNRPVLMLISYLLMFRCKGTNIMMFLCWSMIT